MGKHHFVSGHWVLQPHCLPLFQQVLGTPTGFKTQQAGRGEPAPAPSHLTQKQAHLTLSECTHPMVPGCCRRSVEPANLCGGGGEAACLPRAAGGVGPQPARVNLQEALGRTHDLSHSLPLSHQWPTKASRLRVIPRLLSPRVLHICHFPISHPPTLHLSCSLWSCV